MAREIICSGCSRAVAACDELLQTWLECPHCQERIVNLTALESTQSVWRVAVGVVFIASAVFGALAWLLPLSHVIYEILINRALPHGPSLVEAVVVVSMIVPCALLFLSGVLFHRAGARPTGRSARTAGAFAALVGALLVVIALDFIINRRWR